MSPVEIVMCSRECGHPAVFIDGEDPVCAECVKAEDSTKVRLLTNTAMLRPRRNAMKRRAEPRP